MFKKFAILTFLTFHQVHAEGFDMGYNILSLGNQLGHFFGIGPNRAPTAPIGSGNASEQNIYIAWSQMKYFLSVLKTYYAKDLSPSDQMIVDKLLANIDRESKVGGIRFYASAEDSYYRTEPNVGSLIWININKIYKEVPASPIYFINLAQSFSLLISPLAYHLGATDIANIQRLIAGITPYLSEQIDLANASRPEIKLTLIQPVNPNQGFSALFLDGGDKTVSVNMIDQVPCGTFVKPTQMRLSQIRWGGALPALDPQSQMQGIQAVGNVQVMCGDDKNTGYFVLRYFVQVYSDTGAAPPANWYYYRNFKTRLFKVEPLQFSLKPMN